MSSSCRDGVTGKAQFVQRAATPANAYGGKADQVLVSSGESNVKAVAFRPPEKFFALRASPFTFHPHRSSPSHRFRGEQIFPSVRTFSEREGGKRNDRMLTDS